MKGIILFIILIIWTFKNFFTIYTNNGIDNTIIKLPNSIPVFLCVIIAVLKYFFLSMLTPAIILGLIYYFTV